LVTVSQFWIYMFAVLISPLLAVQASEILSKRKEARARRLGLFKTLMATRANRLTAEHVQALNMIDIEFHGGGRRSKKVLEAWKAYLNHLNTRQPPDVWLSRGDDLFIELLFSMALSLGYSMDKTEIRSTSYFPTAHGKLEEEQGRLRTGMLELVEGKRSLQVKPPPTSEPPPTT
jgi:hypothetical protein